jgi:hypothetical protein
MTNNFAKMRDSIRDIMIKCIETGIETIDIPEQKIQFHQFKFYPPVIRTMIDKYLKIDWVSD